MFRINSCRLLPISACLAFLLTPSAFAENASGTLVVNVGGLEHTRGKLVAKLFRRGDPVPKGASYLRTAIRLTSTRPKIEFRGVPYGEYALFLFHDENDNGTLDHNFLGIPSEAIGFSAGFRASILSGIPDFDDLNFAFSKGQTTQHVAVE